MAFPSHRFLASLTRPGPAALAALYSLDSTARALTVTILPLHAYETYKSVSLAQADSLVGMTYAGVSLFSLAATFAAPWVIYRFGVKRAYLVSIAIFLLGMAALATGTILGLLGGIAARALNGVLGAICIILLIVQTVPKGEFVRSETLRLFVSSIAWGSGPVIGIALYSRYGILGPAVAAGMVHLCLIAYFRRVGFSESPAEATPPPTNPFRLVRRFTSQKQLRLSWLIVFGRSSWWSMFFTYPALYLADRGLAEDWAGWLAGAGNVVLALSPLVRTLASKIGMKRPIILSFGLTGAVTIAAALVYDRPALVCAAILLGACLVVILDTLGNIPFMRFARPSERARMTTVFRTYVDAAELVPSALFACLLLVFDFRAVFIASGIMMLLAGLSATRLPRRL